MKFKNNHYGMQKIFGNSKLNLQLFADDEEEVEEDEDSEEEEDDSEEEEDDKEKGKKGERTYTKKELGAIVAREVAKALKQKEKDKSEAEKLEDMTAEQKAAHIQAQKDAEVEELKRKVARMELSKSASKLLKESELDPSEEILDFVVGSDAEETKENIAKFVKIKDAIVLAAEKARNTGTTPKVVTGNNKNPKITKDDLAKMDYKDVLAFKQKHPDDYKKIMED